MTSKSEPSKGKQGISRRTVVAGTAWAVPAIVVASAAPAFALSGPVTFTANACKDPGNNSRYLFQISVTNGTNVPLTIHPVNLVVNNDIGETICPGNQVVAPNSTATFTFIAGTYDNSANGTAIFNYTYGPTGNEFVGQASSGFNNLPPIMNSTQCQLSIPATC